MGSPVAGPVEVTAPYAPMTFDQPGSGTRMHLVVNSLAGGYSQHAACRVGRCLEELGFEPQYHVMAALEDVQAVSAFIQKSEPNPFIVVAGGDGTVNAVLNGLEPGKAKLAVIPLGTANVLARELGIDSTGAGLRGIRDAVTKPLTVGVLRFADGQRYFSLMVGIGFDGAVVKGVGEREKRFLKKGAYALSAMRALWRWDKRMMTVTSGGEEFECHSVVVSNAARYGGNFLLAPEQDISSPNLSVLCINSSRRATYAALALDLLLGRRSSADNVRVLMTSELSVAGNKPIQADGDFVGSGAARLTVIENFAHIICGAAKAFPSGEGAPDSLKWF